MGVEIFKIINEEEKLIYRNVSIEQIKTFLLNQLNSDTNDSYRIKINYYTSYLEILHLSIVKISIDNKFFEIKWQLGNIKYLSLKYYKFDKRFFLCVSEYDINLNYNIGINSNYETFIDIYTDMYDYYSSIENGTKCEKVKTYNLIEIDNFVKNLIQQIGKKKNLLQLN